MHGADRAEQCIALAQEQCAAFVSRYCMRFLDLIARWHRGTPPVRVVRGDACGSGNGAPRAAVDGQWCAEAVCCASVCVTFPSPSVGGISWTPRRHVCSCCCCCYCVVSCRCVGVHESLMTCARGASVGVSWTNGRLQRPLPHCPPLLRSNHHPLVHDTHRGTNMNFLNGITGIFKGAPAAAAAASAAAAANGNVAPAAAAASNGLGPAPLTLLSHKRKSSSTMHAG